MASKCMCLLAGIERYIDLERAKRIMLHRKDPSTKKLIEDGFLKEILEEPLMALETTERDCDVDLSKAKDAVKGLINLTPDVEVSGMDSPLIRGFYAWKRGIKSCKDR